MQATEIVRVAEPVVACDGDAEPADHPRVFLNMGDKTAIDCPYCGRRFELDPGAKRTAGR